MQKESRKRESRIYRANRKVDSTKDSPFLSSKFNLRAKLAFFGNLSCKQPVPSDSLQAAEKRACLIRMPESIPQGLKPKLTLLRSQHD